MAKRLRQSTTSTNGTSPRSPFTQAAARAKAAAAPSTQRMPRRLAPADGRSTLMDWPRPRRYGPPRMKTRPAKAPPIPAHPKVSVLEDEVVWDGRFPVQRVRFRYTRFDGAP